MVKSPDPASSTLLKPPTDLVSVRVDPGEVTIEHDDKASSGTISAPAILLGDSDKFTGS
jgi:hypothetical protein